MFTANILGNQTLSNPLWTALITPFKDDLSIDWDTLANLLTLQENAGIGIVILGTTGESMALSLLEKKEIIRFVFSNTVSIPIIIGVPNLNLEDALSWIADCAPYNPAGFMISTPVYSKPGQYGQIEWFSKILDHCCSIAVMLYNNPGRTGVSIHPHVLYQLKDHPSLWSLKEASGQIHPTQNYKESAPNLVIFCGDDGALNDTVPFGSEGLVSVLSNAFPYEAKTYVHECLTRIHTDSYYSSVCRALMGASNPIPIKLLMHHLGIIPFPTVRSPLSLLDFSELERNSLYRLIPSL